MCRSDDVVLDFSLKRESAGYKERNEFLKRLYEKHTQASYETIYADFQDCNEEESTDWQSIEYCESRTLSVHSSQYWYQVSVRQETISSVMNLIKVYMSPVDRIHLAVLFQRAVDMLVKQGTGGFYAKMAKCKRSDALCFWVEKRDLPLLEAFAQGLVLECPLPFVAYRGKLGISREMASWDSYNALQAKLIAAYFKTCPASPDLEEMYKLLILAWHRELPLDHPVTREFQAADVQVFLVLLKSIEVIAGDSQIDDEHYLLRADIVDRE